MKKPLSRRDFLKFGGLALSSMAFAPYLPFEPMQQAAAPVFTPVFPRAAEQDHGMVGRVTVNQIDLRSEPRDDAPIIGNRFRDQLVHIYDQLVPPDAPVYYNPLWYRVWGGYLHSAYLQIVQIRHNNPLSNVPQSGQLCEVTVPYTVAYQYSESRGWYPWRGTPLYFETTHWATGIETGPDGEAWYQITNEISKGEIYYVPAIHLRPFAPEELAPISADVPPEKKKIEVSLSKQLLQAFEHGEEVFSTKVSSGIPSRNPAGSLPTATPRGRFRIYSKLPSKHMGSITGNPDALGEGGFSLPGVPWTSFFAEGGYAFHGTYWHNNFGLQMSHGCINMRNPDAQWLFRWTTPEFSPLIDDHGDWERTGNGTVVEVR